MTEAYKQRGLSECIQKELAKQLGAISDLIHLADGFPMPVCHFKRANFSQIFSGEAAYGYCASKGETYYGSMALYFPTITLTGNYGQASKSLSNLFKASSNTWSLGTSLVGPIFTWGNIEGQVLQAKAETKAACFAYQQTILSAFADVENTLVSWNKLQKQYLAEKKGVLAYKNYANLAWLKYNEGYSPYLEVLFAQTQLYPAELNVVQTKAAIFISLINIYKATGGGWVIEADKLTCVCAPTARCKPKC